MYIFRSANTFAALLIPAVFAVLSLARAQSFEVATVKRNQTGESGSSVNRLKNGVFTAKNAPLGSLLGVAYGITGVRISGPAWLNSDAAYRGARPFSFEDGQLLAQREDFQRGLQTTHEKDPEGRENCKDEIDHESPL
jgi:hypothetical protein